MLTWSKKTKYGWKTLTFRGDWWQTFLSARTISFSPLVSLMLTACIRSRDAMIRVPSSLNFTSRENGFGLYSHSWNKPERCHRKKCQNIDGGVHSSLEVYAKFTDFSYAFEHLFDLDVYLLQIKTPVRRPG